MAKYRYEGAYPATVTLPDGSTEVVKPGQVVELGKAPTGRNWKPVGGHHTEHGAADQSPTTVAGILAAVDGDVEKATAALAAEQETARPRKGLIEQLEAIIAAAAPAQPYAAADDDASDDDDEPNDPSDTSGTE